MMTTVYEGDGQGYSRTRQKCRVGDRKILRTVKPMYLQFIEPSKRFADIIIPQGATTRLASA